jgi:phage terminase large subunit GpA-like protein
MPAQQRAATLTGAAAERGCWPPPHCGNDAEQDAGITRTPRGQQEKAAKKAAHRQHIKNEKPT